MSNSDKVWGWLERWRATLFLIAGGLLIVTAAIDAMNAFAGTSIPNDVSSTTAFGGLVLTFVGFLGLYPRLSDGAPRVARVGVLLLALPAIFFAVFLVKVVLAQFIAVPPLAYQIPAVDVVTGAVFFLFAIGVSMFGSICLRREVLSRSIGLLLFVAAAPWFWLAGWLVLYGLSIQPWAVMVQFGVLAVVLLDIGYLLRTTSRPIDPADQPARSIV